MSNRGDYRPIYAVLLDSSEFQALSKDAKLLFYALKLSLGPSGIDLIYDDQAAERAGLTAGELGPARQELIDGEWIQVEGRLHWIRNGLEFEPTISLKNAKQRMGIERHLHGLPKLAIVNRFAAYYELALPFPAIPPERHTNGPAMAIERVSNGHRSKEPEPDREPEREKEKEPEGSPVGHSDDTCPEVADPEPPDQPTDQPDALREMLTAYPAAEGIMGGLTYLAGPLGQAWAEATLRQRFLYPDPDPGMGHEAVKGLELPDRQRLVAIALLEFRGRSAAWDVPFFAGFVRRLRDQGGRVLPPSSSSNGAPMIVTDREGNPLAPIEPAEDVVPPEEVADLLAGVKAKLKAVPVPDPHRARRRSS